MELQLVIFKLGNESFGVEIATVESIIKMQTITRLPQSPGFVEGIINLRGKILPVVDLRKRLGIDLTEITKDSRMVVVALASTTVGMVVDRVDEVLLDVRVPRDVDGLDGHVDLVETLPRPFEIWAARRDDAQAGVVVALFLLVGEK